MPRIHTVYRCRAGSRRQLRIECIEWVGSRLQPQDSVRRCVLREHGWGVLLVSGVHSTPRTDTSTFFEFIYICEIYETIYIYITSALGEAILEEYVMALHQIASTPAFQEDCCSPPETWRRSPGTGRSVGGCQLIVDGRLPQGWHDAAAIEDVQRDVCAEAVPAFQQVTHTQPLRFQPLPLPQPFNPREDYRHETEGKKAWNWGTDCGFCFHPEYTGRSVCSRMRLVHFHTANKIATKRESFSIRCQLGPTQRAVSATPIVCMPPESNLYPLLPTLWYTLVSSAPIANTCPYRPLAFCPFRLNGDALPC